MQTTRTNTPGECGPLPAPVAAPAGRRGRRDAAPRDDDRGLSESVQWSLAAVAVIAVLLGSIQAAMLMHARSCAAEAALGGAEAQAARWGGDGAAVARGIAVDNGFERATAVVGGDPDRVSVSVVIPVARLLGGGTIQVRSTAVLPRER